MLNLFWRKMFCAALGLVAVFVLAGVARAGTDGARIVYDFETGNLQGWQVTEGFFEKPVLDRAKEHNTGKPYVKGGTWFLTTLEKKYDARGPSIFRTV